VRNTTLGRSNVKRRSIRINVHGNVGLICQQKSHHMSAEVTSYVSRSHIICQQKSHHMSAECWPYMSADTHTHTHLICQQKLDHWSQALPGGHVQRRACSWGKKILVGKKKQTFWFYMSYTHIHRERERDTQRHTHTHTHTRTHTHPFTHAHAHK